ncbi:kinesin family member 13 [Cavenderia fasciculata]|uniref:Kinesin family member 13 n=1 Tax=Cavenderia fasciculata TaxID=261658 RepID=F4QBA2_CACFS|nr:kinesin family member 13 [Cavenderia fasciculata]EGG14874.1 kinesin family member 13 [Cavenderia fasciculata]|eukprot:XP_004351390.1 kinesin family member 13 [Cavenderia fasciculata]
MITGASIHNQINNNSTSKKEEKKSVQNVQAFVRVRPLSPLELQSKEASPLDCISNKDIVCTYKGSTRQYQFDHVFPQDSRQQDLFDVGVRPIADEVLNGFNGTIFVYGQTGTGKTYTMEGKMDMQEEYGIIPRTIHYIFQTLEKAGSDYNVRVSHLEIYKEEIYDLLACNSSNEHKSLNVYGKYINRKKKNDREMKDDSRKGTTVPDLEEIVVSDTQSIMSILSKSCKRRQTAETLYNKQSSRSHCIFSVTIHIKETTLGGEDLIKIGKLNLVDLAGSENAQKSGSNNERLREASVINQSLLTLGRVISALTSDTNSHIPYRDSKLTRLLQDSLGGKTKTSIIATVSPSSINLEETVNTLDYAFKAKNIKNTPQINQKMSKNSLLKEQAAEIGRLKQLLQAAYDKNGVYLTMDVYKTMEQTIDEQKAKLSNMDLQYHNDTKQIQYLRQSLIGFNTKFNNMEKENILIKEEYQQQSNRLEEWKNDDSILRDTIELAINDLSHLHMKIDKMKSNEIENQKNNTKSKKELVEKIGELNEIQTNVLLTNINLYQSIKSDLLDFQSTQQTETNNLTNNVNRMNVLMNGVSEKISMISNSLLDSTLPLSKLPGENSSLVSTLDKTLTSLKHQFEQFVGDLESKMAGNGDKIKELIDGCIDSFDIVAEKNRVATEQQHEELQKVIDVLNKTLEEKNALIATQKQQHQELLDKQVKAKLAWEKKLVTKMTQVITQMSDSLYQTQSSVYEQAMNDQIASLTNSNDQFKETMSNSLTSLHDTIDNQQLMSTTAQTKTSLEALKESIYEAQQDRDNIIDRGMIKKIEKTTNMCTATNNKHKQSMSNLTPVIQSINKSMIDQQEVVSMVKECESILVTNNTTAKTHQQHLDKHVTKAVSSIDNQLEQLGQHSKSLRMLSDPNQLLNSIPTLFQSKTTEQTGTTPNRKSFVYPSKKEFKINSINQLVKSNNINQKEEEEEERQVEEENIITEKVPLDENENENETTMLDDDNDIENHLMNQFGQQQQTRPKTPTTPIRAIFDKFNSPFVNQPSLLNNNNNNNNISPSSNNNNNNNNTKPLFQFMASQTKKNIATRKSMMGSPSSSPSSNNNINNINNSPSSSNNNNNLSPMIFNNNNNNNTGNHLKRKNAEPPSSSSSTGGSSLSSSGLSGSTLSILSSSTSSNLSVSDIDSISTSSSSTISQQPLKKSKGASSTIPITTTTSSSSRSTIGGGVKTSSTRKPPTSAASIKKKPSSAATTTATWRNKQTTATTNPPTTIPSQRSSSSLKSSTLTKGKENILFSN